MTDKTGHWELDTADDSWTPYRPDTLNKIVTVLFGLATFGAMLLLAL